MQRLPFDRRVSLLNMSLSRAEDESAARWLTERDEAWQETGHIAAAHQYIAHYWQTPWVASFMGGRASLFAIIGTLGLKPGDQIVVPAFTCQCVANAISFNGVEIHFADIETETYGMSARALNKALTSRTRAVLIQYTFGLVCRDIALLLEIARQHGIWIIEDCAHATGGRWQHRLLGTLGDIAFFSSERSKIVNTIHGGWVITANPALGERLMKVYRQTPLADEEYIRNLLHTLRHAYVMQQGGHPARQVKPVPQMQSAELSGLFTPQYRWRMAEPVAELLVLQLSRLESILQRRREGAAFWQQWASEKGFQPPSVDEGAQNTWLRFPLLVDEPKTEVLARMEQELNVEAGVWFTTPIHPQPCHLPDCPVGMDAAKRCINLPTWLPTSEEC